MIKLWPAVGLILLAFPIMEIWFTVAAVHWFGFGAVFLWWLASFAIGVMILRTQRLALKTQMMMLASGQRNPLSAILWMARRTLAAILFLLPGLLSDGLALILLLPWPMPRSLRQQAQVAPAPGYGTPFDTDISHDAGAASHTSAGSIDGEFQRVDGAAAPSQHQER